MSGWSEFSKVHKEVIQTSGSEPKVTKYIFVQAVDSALPISIFLLTIFFGLLGLFKISSTDQQKINWSLHASELCLGVFLGLLKGRK